MNSRPRSFFQRWLVTTLGVMVAAYVVPGIEYRSVLALLLASLLLGVFNAVLRPLLIWVAFPLLLLTLGLFILVINAVLLYWVGALLKGFEVQSFRAAFWGALIISLVSLMANWVLGTKENSVPASRRRDPPPRTGPPEGKGPVIDV